VGVLVEVELIQQIDQDYHWYENAVEWYQKGDFNLFSTRARINKPNPLLLAQKGKKQK